MGIDVCIGIIRLKHSFVMLYRSGTRLYVPKSMYTQEQIETRW